MTDTIGYDALRRLERERLERFAAAFEDVDPWDYDMFAGATASDDEIEAARAAVLRAIGVGSRRDAVERATQAFIRGAEHAITARAFNPVYLYGGSSRSPRIEDRARLFQSLERAVVAVIVWDELDEAERDVLLGRWVRVAERARLDRA